MAFCQRCGRWQHGKALHCKYPGCLGELGPDKPEGWDPELGMLPSALEEEAGE